MPLTREDLDPNECGMPNCKHDHSVLYLHSRCHPHAAIEAAYVKGTGTLVVRCAKCKAMVAELLIAAKQGVVD